MAFAGVADLRPDRPEKDQPMGHTAGVKPVPPPNPPGRKGKWGANDGWGTGGDNAPQGGSCIVAADVQTSSGPRIPPWSGPYPRDTPEQIAREKAIRELDDYINAPTET